jgi:2-polyprenyl-3-methyl-5-hydroxy-6-metoxy-1,4-benzoquinol methylase
VRSLPASALTRHDAQAGTHPDVCWTDGTCTGGFKLWEGAADLVAHLQETEKLHGVSYAGKRVLELGCGHGVPGIYLWKQGAEVHLQDYVRA